MFGLWEGGARKKRDGGAVGDIRKGYGVIMRAGGALFNNAAVKTGLSRRIHGPSFITLPQDILSKPGFVPKDSVLVVK